MQILKYKGYEGSVDVAIQHLVCRGRILFVTDLVTYKAAALPELQAQFEAAVDDYIATCVELGRSLQMPTK